MPRTGSGSLWGVFNHYRSLHEYQRDETINKLLDYRENKISRTDLVTFLRNRDASEGPEMDSANFFYLEPAVVIEAFPRAKFYLAIRAGDRWVVSFIDALHARFSAVKNTAELDMQWVKRYGSAITPQFDPVLFRTSASLAQRVKPLLPQFAAFWGKSTLASLEAISRLPRAQRLVIYTEQLNESTGRLAEFAGVPEKSLDLTKIHLNRDQRPEVVENILGKAAITDAVKPWQAKVDEFLRNSRLLEQ